MPFRKHHSSFEIRQGASGVVRHHDFDFLFKTRSRINSSCRFSRSAKYASTFCRAVSSPKVNSGSAFSGRWANSPKSLKQAMQTKFKLKCSPVTEADPPQAVSAGAPQYLQCPVRIVSSMRCIKAPTCGSCRRQMAHKLLLSPASPPLQMWLVPGRSWQLSHNF